MRFIYTKAFAAFFGVVALAAVLLFLDSKGFVDPVKRAFLEAPRPIVLAVQAVINPVKDFVHTVSTLRSVITENARLTTRVHELEKSQILLDTVTRENDLLKREIGFTKNQEAEMVPCNVLAYDPEGITDTFVLNCGQKQGIREGMVVMSDQYVAGKVIFSGISTSTARVLTHPENALDAKISRSDSLGVVKGSFAAGLVFESLSQGGDIVPGDLIVTAGVNSLVPQGLKVGEVREIISKEGELFKKVTIVSPLRFRTLLYVFVVK